MWPETVFALGPQLLNSGACRELQSPNDELQKNDKLFSLRSVGDD
jgi:hypothetical protein